MFLDHLWMTNAEVLEANPDIWQNIQDIAQRGSKLFVFIRILNLNKKSERIQLVARVVFCRTRKTCRKTAPIRNGLTKHN
jgi:Tfp pilus assembly protein PilZ